MKFQAIKRDGKYVAAGFGGVIPQPGDTVEEYDDAKAEIVAEIVANRPKPDSLAALRAELKAKGVL